MELIIFVTGLCGLAFIAMRHGYDSRLGVWSKEEEMSLFGVSSEDQGHQLLYEGRVATVGWGEACDHAGLARPKRRGPETSEHIE